MRNARTAINRLLVLGLIVLALGGSARFYLSPFFYQYGKLWFPVWGWRCLYTFCKYQTPPNYEYLEYAKSENKDPTQLILYKNKESGQILAISAIREHMNVTLDKVRVDTARFPWSQFTITHRIGGEWDDKRNIWTVPPEFEFTYLLPPLFLDQELRYAGQELILRGMSSDSPKIFETQKTRVWYTAGRFTKLGFFKQPRGIWRFPIPVFDFKRPMAGAVAVIQDKATGHTLIAVGAVPKPHPFNEPEFRTVVDSLTFDAEPVPDPTAGLPIQRSLGFKGITVEGGALKIGAIIGIVILGLWVLLRRNP